MIIAMAAFMNLEMILYISLNYLILAYTDKYYSSNDFKENLVDIIENGADVNDNMDNKDKIILHSISYVVDLYGEEKKYFN